MIKKKTNSILFSSSIKDALSYMEKEQKNLILITDEKKTVLGTFTMGDFRRAALKGIDLNSKISSIYNSNFFYVYEDYKIEDVKKIFSEDIFVDEIPILDKSMKLIDFINKKSFFFNNKIIKTHYSLKNTSVLIMAGGKGTRLDPFTRILPKPLIPYGDKPIIRVIMDYFYKSDIENFYISVNNKASMIKAYFSEDKVPYNLQFIKEDLPLGTAGSLYYLKDKFLKTFFMINCDIFLRCDFSSIYHFHKKNNFSLTLVASLRSHVIPYGVCSVNEQGELISINEKPENHFLVNTGLYLLEPEILKFVPSPSKNKFDMTDLINKVKMNGMRIGVYPISEKSWIDLGNWNEYHSNTKNLPNSF